MITLVYAISLGVAVFGIGYYLGNQVGKTDHIRRRLERVRVTDFQHER